MAPEDEEKSEIKASAFPDVAEFDVEEALEELRQNVRDRQ